MALGRTYSVALVGLNGYIVEVEADIGQTLPAFIILGLPDASLNEAKERIRSAAQNSGIPLSRRKITANLIPASLPKRGSGFDLAIAMAALLASNDVRSTARTVFIAELGLDGRLRPVRGVLPAVMAAVRAGYADIVVAQANAAEAELVPGARVRAYATLARLAFDFGADPQDLALDFEPELEDDVPEAGARTLPVVPPDMRDVSGQADARRALEVAAAGAHHLLLTGPPGAGKTMLAERLPGLLPDLGDAEAMEVTAIHSLCALTSASLELVRRPPYENPHHTATPAAIIGGGSGLPRPGAASRAHRGVLFLDEAPEYERRVLDALRQPLESGEPYHDRRNSAYPARFQLVLAANPCPCGKATGKGVDCICTPTMRRRYLARMSGPLLDRVDIQLQVDRVSLADFGQPAAEEDSATIAARVQAARERQLERLLPFGMETNAQVPGRVLRGALRLCAPTTRILDHALERGVLTARGYDRVLRLSWTLADLDLRDVPEADDIGLALNLRQATVAA